MRLTKTRLAVWRFVWTWQQAHSYAPSHREIGTHLNLSVSGVHHNLKVLEAAGVLTAAPFRPRTMTVLIAPPSDGEVPNVQPSSAQALARARDIKVSQVRQAHAEWKAWPGANGCAETMHALVGRRCVATLDGVRFLPGVIVAVERCDGGRGRKPPLDACWVWLVNGSPPGWELHVRILKFDQDRVELVTRGRKRAGGDEHSQKAQTANE